MHINDKGREKNKIMTSFAGDFINNADFYMKKDIVITEDGSHTLRVREIDECYHSTHGAVQESEYIFVNSALKHFLSVCRTDCFCETMTDKRGDGISAGNRREIRVLEIGFGTGLNTYLTLLEAEKMNLVINYTSLELYPLSVEYASLLNYPELIDADRELFEKIHRSSWDEDNNITSFFVLHKIKADFTEYEIQGLYDVIYFDAFSPEKQPEMWTDDMFKKINGHSGHEAVMTTYCAKGAVRRAMQAAGFVMERLPGPQGKREILRASKR